MGIFGKMTLPAEMTSRDQWLCWKVAERNGNVTKIPVNARTGGSGKADDKRTWSSYQTAKEYADGRDGHGIGFVFTEEDPLVGVDLDHCFEDGEPQDWATDVINTFESYTERSPSGDGYHIIAQGTLPGDKNRKGNIEMYESGRFFTVTRDRVEGAPQQAKERQNAIEATYYKHIAGERRRTASSSSTPTKIDIEDEEVVEKAKESESGWEFERLMRGDTSMYGDDHSRADLALCSHLAFWTGGDEQQMDSIFRSSGLMREKWDEMRGSETYGEMTIQRAIDSSDDFYEGSSES